MSHLIPYGHQSIDAEDIDAVVSVLKSDWLTTGPQVTAFERAITEYTGCRHAVAVNSGTSALDIAVQALNLPKGAEVITTPFTFAATNNALLYHDLIPVFTDIEKETRNIDPDRIRKNISKKTKAIIFVDYAGQPCRIDEIREIASEHNLLLVEDACHALGASYHSKKIGSFAADMTIYSFHPVKPITTGEGGAVVTDHPDFAEKLRILRTHGIDKGVKDRLGPNADWVYDMVELGRNYRMTDFQAALGISQMKKLEKFIAKRNKIARVYTELLSDFPFIETPITQEGVTHGWHLYTILLENVNRDKFYAFMRTQGIGVNVHYIPTYHFSYYRRNIPVNPWDYPVTEDVFNRIITIPLYPSLTEDEISFIVERIKDAGKKFYGR
jgi:UDP-4-amino-4,6-dideoxy-N-acetyl-beta-L-altrosamine transaminase